MRKTILLVAILLVISPSAFTQQETGNSLLDKLEKRPTTEREGNQVDFLNFGIAFGIFLVYAMYSTVKNFLYLIH